MNNRQMAIARCLIISVRKPLAVPFQGKNLCLLFGTVSRKASGLHLRCHQFFGITVFRFGSWCLYLQPLMLAQCLVLPESVQRTTALCMYTDTPEYVWPVLHLTRLFLRIEKQRKHEFCIQYAVWVASSEHQQFDPYLSVARLDE